MESFLEDLGCVLVSGDVLETSNEYFTPDEYFHAKVQGGNRKVQIWHSGLLIRALQNLHILLNPATRLGDSLGGGLRGVLGKSWRRHGGVFGAS